MKIEMSEFEYLDTFGSSFKDIPDRDFVLNKVKFHCEEFGLERSILGSFQIISMTLVKQIKPKSPQELSAEESVKKAEEALRAAKEVLNKVKEK